MNESIKVDIDFGAKLAEGVKQAAKLREHLEAAARVQLKGINLANKLPQQGGITSRSLGEGESKTARSIGKSGGTGSATSDFAEQARGLGGLVHVYATFAANIFAVTAAFSALSKAADFSNMIKGLDQLGAASGEALGTLSKRLVEVTDGAISLKDSMNAVAIANAGGMSNAAILRMGKVAKQASIALGRDMPDAMERLSKGIIKVQPELLDELGIMTRVIPAQQAYALSIGKTASALTDLEKKQAFANAVLKEGEEKFGAIELSANNYSKILASMTNIAYTGLEAVNKFLSPLVSLLASSPTALATAMAAVAAVLLKQAIPAIGQFKEQTAKAAEQAESLANKRNSLVKTALAKELASNLEATKIRQNAAKAAMAADIKIKKDHLEAMSQAEIDKVDALEKQIRSMRDTSFKKSTASYKILSATDPSQVTAKDLKILEGQATRFTKLGETDKAATYTSAIKAIKDWNAAEAEYVRKDDQFKQELKAHSDKLDKAYKEQEASNEKLLNKRHTLLSIQGRQQAEADRANLASATRNIASNAAQTASVQGFAASMKQAHAEIQAAMAGPKTVQKLIDTDQVDQYGKTIQKLESITTPAMGKMRAGWTYVSAGISSATTAISGFMGFLGPWVAFAGIVVAAGLAFHTWTTRTEKESAATASALEDLKAAVTGVDNIVTSLSKKNPLEQITTASINAKAGAFTNLAESIALAVSTSSEELKKMGTIDIVVDITKFIFNKDVFSVAAKEASIGLAKSIKLMGTGPEAMRAKAEISKLLGGVDINSFKEINEFIGQNNATYFDRMPKINAILASLGQVMRDTASKALELDDAFKVASKTYDTITTSLMPTDNLAKLGFEMQTLGQKMTKAFSDPVTAISELVSISGDVTKLRFFDPKTAETLINDADSIKRVASQIKSYTDLVSELTVKEQQLDAQIKAKQDEGYGNANSLIRKRNKVVADKQASQELLGTLNSSIAPYLAMLKTAQNESFTKGAKLVADSIGMEFQKSSISIAKALSEGLGGTIGGLDQRARLDKEAIGLQIKQIETQLSLVDVNERLVATQEERNLRDQREALNASGINTLKDVALLKELTQRIRASEIRRESPINTNKELIDTLKNSTGARLYAAQGQVNSVQQKTAASAQISALTAQQRNLDTARDFTKMKLENDARKDILTVDASRLALEKARIDSQEKSLAYTTTDLLNARLRNNEDIVANKLAQEYLDFSLNISKVQKVIAESKDPKAVKENQQALIETTNAFNNKRLRDEEERKAREISNIELLKSALQSKFNYEQEQEAILLQAKTAAFNVEAGIREERINQQSILESLSTNEIASLNTKLALDRESARVAEVIANSKKEEAAKIFEIDQRTKTASGTGELERLNAEAQAIKDRYAKAREGEQSLSAAKLETLRIQGIMNKLTAKQTEEMSAMSDVAGNLAIAFEDMGGAVGKVGEALLKMLHTQELLDKRKEKGPLSEKEEAKFKKDQINADLKGITLVTSATKELIDTKSDGYRILSGIEKAAATASSALRAKELVETISTVGASIAARIPGIYAAFMQQFGLPGAALATAAIATFIGISGKGGASGYTGPSAAEIQKTQGTGQAYNNQGILTETGGGVLGDIAAKSNSIDNSLDIISSTSIENLTYANKMLDALNSIKDNISAAATALFKTSGINKAGKTFGIVEGTTETTSILGTMFKSTILNPFIAFTDKLLGGAVSKIFSSTETTYVQNQGVKFIGSFKDILDGIGGSLQEFTTTITETSNIFGGSKSANYYTKELDSSVSTAIQGIFSSAADIFTTQGTQLGKTAESVMSTLENFDVSRLASLQGLKGEELTTAFTDSINGILDDAARKIYPELLQFQKGGEAAFETVNRVLDGSYKVKTAFDSIGKSIEELANGMSGYNISEGLIKAAGGLDNLLSQTKQFGDDFLTEAERLAPIQKNLTSRLSELGYASTDTREEFKQLILGFKFTGEESYKTYASLLALAPAFSAVYAPMEKVKDVLSAIELASSKMDLQIKILTLLGDTEGALALTRSKELEKMDERLVGTQKYVYALEDEANARTKLDSIIKATISTISSAIKSLKDYKAALTIGDKSTMTPAERYASTKSTLQAIAAAASTSGNTEAEKAAQADALSKLPAASDTFLAASKEMYASSSQYSSDFNTVLSILDSTSNALNNQKSTAELQLAQLEGSSALLGGIQVNTKTTSELLQQYLVLAANVSTAKASSTTVGQVTPSTSASSPTGSISTGISAPPPQGVELLYSMLAGRKGDAGGISYWNSVLASGASKSDVIRGFISSLMLNGEMPTKYAADMASKGPSAVLSIPGFANGGLANGLAMVGEKGPELVDFKSPGRVYSNTASNDMFNLKEVVAELKAVKQELAQLRKEQKEQTGHVIASNYDANGKVAEAVVNTAEANLNSSAWISRAVPKIA